MPTPFAPRISVPQNARSDLQTLVRAHGTPQSLALRPRIVLRAADSDTPTHVHIGRDLGCSHRTVGTWRRRSHDLGCSGLQDAPRSGRPRTMVSPTRVRVISVASALPQQPDRTVTRWTLEEIVATWLADLHSDAISRSSLWRILNDIDLTPQKSAYWLNRHDAHCDAKAHAMCQRSIKALEEYQQGRWVICCDAKTGRHVLERTAPTKPAQPGRRARRAPEYIRHGTRGLMHSLAVATGPMAWTIGATRKATDCVAHLKPAHPSLPSMQRYDGVMDNLHTHGSLDVCRLVASWCQGPFAPKQRKTGTQRRAFLCDPSQRHLLHFTPKHGSWLNQAALFFGVLHRRFLARGSLCSAQEFAVR